MQNRASAKELRGIRTWSSAIRRWTHDSAEILASQGLTWSGYGVLLATYDGPRRSGVLTAELGMTTGGMAKLLKKLETSNLIERKQSSDDDRRAVAVHITDRGRIAAEVAAAEILVMRDAEYQQWGIEGDLQDSVDEAWKRLQQFSSPE